MSITTEDVERWYADQTEPRKLAYKAVWLMLAEGNTGPGAWRPVEAALNAYEAASGSPSPSEEYLAGYAEAVARIRDHQRYWAWDEAQSSLRELLITGTGLDCVADYLEAEERSPTTASPTPTPEPVYSPRSRRGDEG